MLDSFTVPDESISLDASRLPWLVDRYLSSIRGRVAAETCKKYRQKINHFLRWASDYTEITQETMVDFASYLAGTRLKITTQSDVVRRVGQLFSWAHRRNVAKLDYSLWLPVVRAPDPVFAAISQAQVQKLLDVCGLMRHGLRNQAFVALLASTGLRLSEAVALTVRDIEFDAGGGGCVTVRHGKGSKSRKVVFARRYEKYLRALIANLGHDASVFDSQKGVRLTASGAHKEVNLAAELAGLTLSCHDLRRYFATQWIKDHPGRIVELQMQMGHSNISTTMRYVWLGGEHIKQLVQE